MTFNTPNINDILTTLIGNNMLVSALKENGALITKETLLNEYHLSVMKQAVADANLRNIQALYDLAELILVNEEHIRKESVWQLTAEEFLFKEIRSIFGLEKANDKLYQSIFYCYKYCYVSSFFQNNADKFVPQCDIDEIRSNPAAEAFLDSVLKEFDKINRLLEETKDFLDYDKIPWKYIVYLTQLLGLEKDTFNIDETEEVYYRELAKNILDIYRIKGTNYSFQLFFNFLGIDIEIKEFFFDRRYFYAKYPQENTFTNTSDKYSKDFYLTTVNPSYNLNPNFSSSEIVTLNDFSPQESLKDFEELALKYGLEAVLGYSKYDKNGEEYKERVYKYFKTNYIYYYAGAMGGRANLTSKQINSLAKYLDFLTPIFVMRDIKTVAFTMSDNDSIAFDGDNGDRKYGALIDGTYEGFQMLDGECWDTINKDLYLTVTDDGENKPIYYAKNGKQIEYRNSLPDWNDIDTKTFRQPLEFSAMNIYTSRYLGYEKYFSKDGIKLPEVPAGRRLKFYTYNDKNGTIYKYSEPKRVNIDVSKTSLEPEVKPIDPKISSTKGKDSVRNEIEKNNYYKEIKYSINSNGSDVNDLLNSKDAIMSELLKCSWKENLLSYTPKMIKTEMYAQSIDGTTIGSTTIRYPIELEENADKILGSFNIVLATGDRITNPKTEGEAYFKSIYVPQNEIKQHLVVGDYYVKYENKKFYIYRCCYENKKVWFLTKLFPDVKVDGINEVNKNNMIQLSGNFRNERNLSNALSNFFAVCVRGDSKIDRYSHLYKISEGGGYYYAPAQLYTQVYGEDSAKPASLSLIPEDERVYYKEGNKDKGYYVRGKYEGNIDLVGKTFFEGTNISYDNVNITEDSVKNNMRYICFWDRQIGDLIYDEYDGKVYCVCNYGPKGLVEIKLNGCVKEFEDDEHNKYYRIYEYDNFWKGYDEEADTDDFIAYNNKHIISWPAVGIYSNKWHRPIKMFTDKLYDDSVNNNFNFCRNFNIEWPFNGTAGDGKLFSIEEDLQGERSFRKMLLRDIWNRSYESFSEDLKNDFIRRIIDPTNLSDDNPETNYTEGYNTEELFTKFYGFITRDEIDALKREDAPDYEKISVYENLINLLKGFVEEEVYELRAEITIDDLQSVKALFGISGTSANGINEKAEWYGINGRPFDKYYNFRTGEFVDRVTAIQEIIGGAFTDYRGIDINKKLFAKGVFSYDGNYIKDDYGEYLSPNYLMLDFLEKTKANSGTALTDDFLKDYFYEGLLQRWREVFISDDNGMSIDSKDYGLFQGMPLTIEKWNGKGGKFAAPRILNSQLLNEGSDNFSSTRVPLKSITFRKNNETTIPVEIRGSNSVIKKPSTDIIFTIGFADWYYNTREVFGTNNISDFNGRLTFGGTVDEAIAELRENYIKCFTPRMVIPLYALNENGEPIKDKTTGEYVPTGFENLKFFKNNIEKDYASGYEYHVYYVNGNETPREITSIEQGVVTIFYNGKWPDWTAETNNILKTERLRHVFNKSIIQIKINDSSRNKYLTSKRYKSSVEDNLQVLSDCIRFGTSDEAEMSREGYGNIGFITLKYLRHKFRDNYVSVPNSIDWIKIKNGKRDEYTSYGDDREVASRTIKTEFYNSDGKISNYKLENKIKLLNEGGVINLEDGSIIEDVSYEYYSLGKKKFIKKIKSNGVDVTNKAKKIEKRENIFAQRLIDKNGNLVLRIKDFSLSDIKQLIFSFTMIFVKFASNGIRVVSRTSSIAWVKRIINNLILNIQDIDTFVEKIGVALFPSIQDINTEEIIEAIGLRGTEFTAKRKISVTTKMLYKAMGIIFWLRSKGTRIYTDFVGKIYRAIKFYTREAINVFVDIVNIRHVGRYFVPFGNILADSTFAGVRHIGRYFVSLLPDEKIEESTEINDSFRSIKHYAKEAIFIPNGLEDAIQYRTHRFFGYSEIGEIINDFVKVTTRISKQNYYSIKREEPSDASVEMICSFDIVDVHAMSENKIED